MNSTVTAVKLVAQNGGKTTELFDVSSIAPQMIERVSINQSKLPDSDGGYQLKFTVSSTPRIIDFGYFTNGIELNQSYSIEIESDTVKITPQLRD
ncbi:MAG: hypothetical protein LH606_09370 [Cytophagaceae bacterium]|nr:hypothetical protein [Cytophagaceae bacterium]